MLRFYTHEGAAVIAVATGKIAQSPTGHHYWDVDTREIYAHLVNAANALCRHYKADIQYDIAGIERLLKTPVKEFTQVGVGFRDCGTDHNAFIECRKRGNKVYGDDPYNGMMCLELVPDVIYGTITLTLLDNPGVDVVEPYEIKTQI